MGALGLGIAVCPPAGAAARTPTATGSVTCGNPGAAVITWTVTHYRDVPVPITITSAGMFGAVGGPVTFAPSTVAPGDQATARVEVDGSIIGEVGLTVTITEVNQYSFGAGVMLRGDCAPPTTTAPPPPPPAPAAVEVEAIDAVLPTYVG